MRKRVIHFGAGALGRGLVVPTLVDSGFEVVLVDTSEGLLEKLNQSKEYTLDQTDSENRFKTIPIVEALSPIKDKEKLDLYLSEATIVTTSVRRENLIHVARTLVSGWGKTDVVNRLVICGENIENVGSLFSSLLEQVASTPEERRRVQAISIPDTIVDRICAAFADSTIVMSETFYEFSVDEKVLACTGIDLIPSVPSLDREFVRKRLLLNTYADAISFFAKHDGKTYLYEAAESEEIHSKILPYLMLLWRLLETKYSIKGGELVKWSEKYRMRLRNQEIPRKLDTVARNFWEKLTLNERFVWPLIQLMDQGEEIEEGIKFLSNLILIGANQEGIGLSHKEILEKIESLWCSTPDGTILFQHVSPYLRCQVPFFDPDKP